MKEKNKKTGLIMVIIATLFWGYMGISSRFLNIINLRAQDISFARAFTAAVLFSVLMLFTNKSAFKISFKGLIFCVLYGIIAIAFSFTLYSTAVERIPISVATILMFSNPVWVSIFERIFFKEKIGLKKALVLCFCILGCTCIIDIFSSGGSNLDLIGVVAGLLSGVSFALQIILPKFVDGKIEDNTLLLYGFWSAAICLFFFAKPSLVIDNLLNSYNPGFYFIQLLSIGVLSTFIANSCYIMSAKYIGTQLPSMLCSLEPIFASAFAYVVFGEKMKPIQFLGAIIVILSIVALQINKETLKNLLHRKDTNIVQGC